MNTFYIDNKLTNKELMDVFPEMSELIKDKIQEYNFERKNLIDKMRLFYQKVKGIAIRENKDEFFVWFWSYAYIKYFHAPKVVEIDRYLYVLNKQKRLFIKDVDKNNNKYINWDDLKEKAKNQTLLDIAQPYLKKIRLTGNKINASCPFHEDKTPSFVINIAPNTFHCFGCQAHGDAIAFYMKINNISFKNAVKELAT